MAKKTRWWPETMPEMQGVGQGTRAKSCPKCDYNFTNGRPTASAVEAAPVAATEAPAKAANAITLEQIKTVSQMVRTIGGFRCLHEMLGVIKEVGGLKKFRIC